MLHVYRGIVHSHKKERNDGMCSSTDGLGDYRTDENQKEKDKYCMTALTC